MLLLVLKDRDSCNTMFRDGLYAVTGVLRSARVVLVVCEMNGLQQLAGCVTCTLTFMGDISSTLIGLLLVGRTWSEYLGGFARVTDASVQYLPRRGAVSGRLVALCSGAAA